jgi:hypothetical protein
MYPKINLADHSSITRWEASKYNIWHSKIEVIGLSCFRDKMTEKEHSEAKSVPIERCAALDSGITADQRTALQNFKDKESARYAKARAAIYAEYRRSYDTYKGAWSLGAAMFGGDGADVEAVLPKIVKGNELDGLVSFGTIYIFPAKDGVARLGIILGCPWDEEHGMGLVVANGEVVRVGDAGVVYAP